ncbi:aspartic proteinase nepenthesin-1-like [Melia azedarach]|uniref:Aspartic proteinase nepenthesin-1-like n=1 Tax=Melia azedarach TaxID=155640 RepID=A0ACC1YRM2_MELAZ|nr:aspartic proteinase nepenthesin-1-like [Melia azedarach]
MLSMGSTKGIASLESFTFSPDSGPITIINSILSGCSNDNQNFVFAKTGLVSGVSGFSLSPASLASQLFQQITDKRFSYCLVPFADWAYAYLKFGSDIPSSPGNTQTTRFVTKPGSFFYYWNLIDITVESR